jgi:hypothetical protein
MSFSVADAIFWIAVALCSVAQLAILHSVVVSPARVPDAAPTSPARRAAEIAWAVLPGAALAVVLVYTWHAMHPAIAMIPGAAAIPGAIP